MKNYLVENAVREMKKAMRRVEAFRALSKFLPVHEGERFTVADIRKEYPDASPNILAYYLDNSWALGVRVKVHHDAAEIKCKPFTMQVWDCDTCRYKSVEKDSYRVHLYELVSLTR